MARKVQIDKTAPVINSVTLSSAGWTNKAVTATVKVSDNASGLKEIYCATKNADGTYTKEKNIVAVENGDGTYTFKFDRANGKVLNKTYYFIAVDNLGHETFSEPKNIKIDKVAPSVSNITVERVEENDLLYVPKPLEKFFTNYCVKVSATVNDLSAGIKSVQLSYNVQNSEATTLTMNDSDGDNVYVCGLFYLNTSDLSNDNNVLTVKDIDTLVLENVKVVAKDNAENTTTSEPATITYSKVAPTVDQSGWTFENDTYTFTLNSTPGIEEIPVNKILVYSDADKTNLVEEIMPTAENPGTVTLKKADAYDSLYVYAVDMVGNVQKEALILNKDKQAPAISNVEGASLSNSPIEVKVTVDNTNESGKGFFPTTEIAKVYCATKNDDGTYKEEDIVAVKNDDGTYTFTFNTDDKTVLDNTYYFFAVDKAGNVSDPSTGKKIMIDKVAPVISDFTLKTTDPNGDEVDYNETSTNGNVTVTLEAEDPEDNNVASGLAGVYYSDTKLKKYDDVVKATKVEDNTVTFETAQNKTYYFYAVDEARNVSDYKQVTVKIDKTLPTLKVDSVTTEDWTNGDVTVKLTSDDPVGNDKDETAISKVADIYYSDSPLDNYDDVVKATKVEDNTVTFETAQNKRYYFYAVDEAGNVSKTVADGDDKNVVNVMIDKTQPTLKVTSVTTEEWTNGDVTVKLMSDDPVGKDKDETAISKVADIYYSDFPLDTYDDVAKATKVKDNTVTFKTAQNKTYYFYAVDNAGNVSETVADGDDKNVVNIKIDKTLPTLEIASLKTTDTDGNEVDYKQNWTNGNVTVNLTLADPVGKDKDETAVSDVAGIYYSTKSGLNYSQLTAESEDVVKVVGTSVTFENPQYKTYYFYAVDYAGNVSDYKQVTIKIDKTLPTLKVDSVTTEEWTNGDVTVKLTSDDPVGKDKDETAVSKVTGIYYSTESGLTYSQITDANSKKATKVEDNTVTFETAQNKRYYFYAVDEAGNVSKTVADGDDKNVVNVMIDKTQPTLKVTSVTTEEWTNGDVTVKLMSDDPVGKDKDETAISKVADIYYSDFPLDTYDDVAKATKVKDNTVTFKTAQNKTYYFYAVDNAGNVSETVADGDDKNVVNIKIDKTKPAIDVKNCKITAEYITDFGVFDSKGIAIKVRPVDVDSNKVQSGIKAIKIKSGTTELEVEAKDFDRVNGTYTFEIPYGSEFIKNIMYKNIYFVVTDNAGNTYGSLAETNLYEIMSQGSSDALVDDIAPTIGSFEFPEPAYTVNGARWYNTKTVEATATFKDIIKEKGQTSSGIMSCSLWTAGKSNMFDEPSLNNKQTLTLVSSESDVEKNTGKLVFNAEMYDNAGNTASKTEEVYVDTIAPVITGFTVNGSDVSGSDSVYKIDSFSNKSSTVVISAKDNSGKHSGASGVKTITYELINSDGTSRGSHTVAVSAKNTISFTVEPNFKGYIKAYATDNVNNSGSVMTSQRFVAENSSKHGETSDIKIELPSTATRDAKGQKLYAENVNVKFTVTDTYSGIRSVSYTVKDYGNQDGVKTGAKLSYNQIESNLNTEGSQTVTVSNNSNDIEFIVTVTDNAGNVSKKSVKFSIDKTAPVINVSYDNNDYNKAYTDTEYYDGSRKATIEITERNFNESDVIEKITASTGSVPTVSAFTYTKGATPDADKHTATVTFADDADYTFGMSFSDMAGNKAADYGEDKFTVDKTVPEITNVTFSDVPLNDKYFSKNITVSVVINEHNFDKKLVEITSKSGELPSASNYNWSDDGDVHTLSFSLSEDSIYAFSVALSDKATNNSEIFNQSEFVIDQTKPKVEINNIEDMKAYGYGDNGTVAPVLNSEDTNLQDITFSVKRIAVDGKVTDVTKSFKNSIAELNNKTKKEVTFDEFGSTMDIDGIYIIEISGKDLAGNENKISKTFSVNRFGSNFLIDDEGMNNVVHKYLNAGESVSIRAINVNKIVSSEITVTINDKLVTLTEGEDYSVELVNGDTAGNGTWYEYIYTINKEVFEQDGYYSITISSTDEAGNTSSNTNDAHVSDGEENAALDFFIDTIKPEVTVTGADEGEIYKEGSKQITVTCEDRNLDIENLDDCLEITVNGKRITDYEADVSAGIIQAKFEVTGDKITVKASAVDKAGNRSDEEELSFRLNAGLMLRFFANKPLFFGSIAGLLAIIALIIFIIIKKRKDK
ncbi:MAG: hypothetical protein ACI4JA_07390 [Oscillospiraceae bacterium]